MKRAGKRKLSTSNVTTPSDTELPPPPYEDIHGNGTINSITPIPSVSTSNTLVSNVSATADPSLSLGKERDNDKDLVSAAEALTQLTHVNSTASASSTAPISRDSTPPITANGSSITSPISNSSIRNEKLTLPPIKPLHQHPLVVGVNKVTRHPLVTNAVKYYDYSKRNYAPFNYAAEIVEKAAIPVVNKIEVNLNTRYQAKKAKQEARRGAKRRRKLSEGSISSSYSSNFPLSETHSSINSPTISNISYDSSVSIETKKRLQFCLHILKLANEKINNSVQVLQHRVDTKAMEAKEKREAAELLSQVKQDEAQRTKTEIVTTVKNIIRLISNFKPSSLSTKDEMSRSSSPAPVPRNSTASSNGVEPTSTNGTATSETADDDQLKGTIRDIILSLPATVQQSSNNQTNDRVLVFAKESLDMISRLTLVFNNQLEKAEAWVAGEQQQLQEEKQKQDQLMSEKMREELDSGNTSESTTDGEGALAGLGCR